MNKMGYGFRAFPCDVADYDSCVACATQVVKEVGPIDVLINNAGITRDTTFKKMDRVNWDAVIKTNLDSCFNMHRATPRHLLAEPAAYTAGANGSAPLTGQ